MITNEQWVALLQNLGFPIAIIAFFAYYFVKPLGGSDGVVAKFFIAQATNASRQTELMQEQRELVSELAKSITGSSQVQSAHVTESTKFFRDSYAEQSDLMRIHGCIIKAQQLEFTNQKAKDLLSEADEIVQQYLKRERYNA